MQHISNQVTQGEVDRRTTLISADGRVVERGDGCRLLVDAYNVLHRDYDKLMVVHEAAVKEVEVLKKEKEGENTAEVVSRLQSLGDEVCGLQNEVTSLRAQAPTVSAVRLSLADALERLFKTAVDEIGGGEPPAHDHSLKDEIKQLQKSRDRILMVLTTVASKTRQLEAAGKVKDPGEVPFKMQILEGDRRGAIREEAFEELATLYRDMAMRKVVVETEDRGIQVGEEEEEDVPVVVVKKSVVKKTVSGGKKVRSLSTNPLLTDAPQVSIDVGGKVVSTTAECFMVGDIILSADGKSVITQQDITTIAAASPTGVITCRVRRSGVTKTVDYRVKRPGAAPPVSTNPPLPKKKHLSNSSSQIPPRGTVKLRHLNRPATVK